VSPRDLWSALEWTRPLGFAALAMPLLVLIFSLRPARPRAQVVGTFAIWRELARSALSQGNRRRRRVPLERLFAIAALIAGALALAGPRLVRQGEHPAWRLWVDRSPSMYLEVTDAEGAPLGIGTRLQVAAAAATNWPEREDPRASREWCAFEDGVLQVEVSRDLPARWRTPPSSPLEAPRFDLHDEAGALWVTDALPADLPMRAGVFTSGGGPVPGAVAEEGGRLLVWDGRELSKGGTTTEAPRVVTRGDLPALLIEFAELWSKARGLRLEREGDANGAQLLLIAAGEGTPESVQARHEGWRLIGAARRALHGTPWLHSLSGESKHALVTTRPGVVEIAFAPEPALELQGDPAAFAVSWTALFDETRRVAPEVLPLAERRAVAPAEAHSPRAAPVATTPPSPPPLEAGLTLVAALLALLGSLVALGR
jgi:hypothetical protein